VKAAPDHGAQLAWADHGGVFAWLARIGAQQAVSDPAHVGGHPLLDLDLEEHTSLPWAAPGT
jgi:hypothetical protein